MKNHWIERREDFEYFKKNSDNIILQAIVSVLLSTSFGGKRYPYNVLEGIIKEGDREFMVKLRMELEKWNSRCDHIWRGKNEKSLD